MRISRVSQKKSVSHAQKQIKNLGNIFVVSKQPWFDKKLSCKNGRVSQIIMSYEPKSEKKIIVSLSE